ncbi:MAG: acyltransferase [Polyangiaceae bacterium]|jgi:maltose O-acetyltransferase|nr:acyltransferase [Polyangiaceae bacterium]
MSGYGHKLQEQLRALVGRAEDRARRLPERARYALDVVRGYYYLRGTQRSGRVYVHGSVRVDPRGTIVVGQRSMFLDGVVRTELIAHPHAEIQIGCDCGFAYGLSVEARSSVRIGNRCMTGAMVRICDFAMQHVAPVVIEDDVWLAHGVIIEPGVRIGRRSVVSTGSVVTKDIPPEHMALGNPARAMPLQGFWRDRSSVDEGD